MASEVITTQLITVASTIVGALITGIITILSQHINNKNKDNEIKQQLRFKIFEEELKERKKIIIPLLQYIDAYNLPQNHDFVDDDGEWIERAMIKTYPQIKKEISDFMLNYAVYMNDTIRNAIWSLSFQINHLSELESKFYNSAKSNAENEDLFYMNCGNEPAAVWNELIKLREVLYAQIVIHN
ncbi:hypothetical protein LMJ45_02415 [Enterobacter cloacae]|uniref:hypothetical protein n=1 Tax=Enterobacter cloacae TaxID=550 RepID=UPI000BE70CE1|nr:hypothetical protein [Enterobacter cloacae]PDP91480.1 hypothetical protein CGQ17_14510 [Enterobacter cloacae]RWT21191.1 hypothetical protein DN460_25845 [Enterobacter cloacae]UER84350.1 hypothetical protein LMJ45_02415 [Enterobacter cloacae]